MRTNKDLGDQSRVGRQPASTVAVPHRRSKYHATPTTVDGIRFASKKEATRYGELKLLEKAGHIARLKLQQRFELCVPRTNSRGNVIDAYWMTTVGHYVADFCYDEFTPAATLFVIEDVKGFRTPLYRWKKKHVESQYGVTIRET